MIFMKRSYLMILNRFGNWLQQYQVNFLEKKYVEISDHERLGYLHKNWKISPYKSIMNILTQMTILK